MIGKLYDPPVFNRVAQIAGKVASKVASRPAQAVSGSNATRALQSTGQRLNPQVRGLQTQIPAQRPLKSPAMVQAVLTTLRNSSAASTISPQPPIVRSAPRAGLPSLPTIVRTGPLGGWLHQQWARSAMPPPKTAPPTPAKPANVAETVRKPLAGDKPALPHKSAAVAAEGAHRRDLRSAAQTQAPVGPVPTKVAQSVVVKRAAPPPPLPTTPPPMKNPAAKPALQRAATVPAPPPATARPEVKRGGSVDKVGMRAALFSDLLSNPLVAKLQQKTVEVETVGVASTHPGAGQENVSGRNRSPSPAGRREILAPGVMGDLKAALAKRKPAEVTVRGMGQRTPSPVSTPTSKSLFDLGNGFRLKTEADVSLNQALKAAFAARVEKPVGRA